MFFFQRLKIDFCKLNLLFLAYGSKEKTNTGWKFLNNYINKKEKQGDKAKNQLYKFLAYNIKWKSEHGVCVKPEFMDGHVCYELRNSLGGYGSIRVVRVSDDLGGSSSRGRGGIVAKSAVVHSRWCFKNLSEFRWVLMAVACSSLVTYWPSTEPSIKGCTCVNKQKDSETGASGWRYRNITLTCGRGWIRCRWVHSQETGGRQTII